MKDIVRLSSHGSLMHDLFLTAIEGGINYWTTSINEYHWSIDGKGEEDDIEGFSAIIEYEHPETNEPTISIIDRKVMARGYRLAVSQHWIDRISWSCETPPVVVTPEGWDYDAFDADVVLQLGLFGQVHFG